MTEREALEAEKVRIEAAIAILDASQGLRDAERDRDAIERDRLNTAWWKVDAALAPRLRRKAEVPRG